MIDIFSSDKDNILFGGSHILEKPLKELRHGQRIFLAIFFKFVIRN